MGIELANFLRDIDLSHSRVAALNESNETAS